MPKKPGSSHTFDIGPMMREEIRRALVGVRRPWGISAGRWQLLSRARTDYITSGELLALSEATNGGFIPTLMKAGQ